MLGHNFMICSVLVVLLSLSNSLFFTAAADKRRA